MHVEERVEMLEKKVRELENNKSINFVKPPEIGDRFEFRGIKFTCLDKVKGGYLVIADFLDEKYKFDEESNNWRDSELSNILSDSFVDEIGRENLHVIERDLTSLDGLKDYGGTYDLVSILTADEYKKYRSLLPNTGEWWWLCTPWSTKSNGYESSVAVVAPAGNICSSNCDCNYGVRPVCILKSEIFES